MNSSFNCTFPIQEVTVWVGESHLFKCYLSQSRDITVALHFKDFILWKSELSYSFLRVLLNYVTLLIRVLNICLAKHLFLVEHFTVKSKEFTAPLIEVVCWAYSWYIKGTRRKPCPMGFSELYNWFWFKICLRGCKVTGTFEKRVPDLNHFSERNTSNYSYSLYGVLPGLLGQCIPVTRSGHVTRDA